MSVIQSVLGAAEEACVAADRFTDCDEHAGLSCRSWCKRCQQAQANIDDLDAKVDTLRNALILARVRFPKPGIPFRHDSGGEFLGVPVGPVLFETNDGDHHFDVQSYEFPTGEVLPYVCAWEQHDDGHEPRIMSLPTVVHLLQNVGETEAFQIGNRRVRGA